MAARKYIGIVGGAGTVGSIMIDYLLKEEGCPHILIGGRRKVEAVGIVNRIHDKRVEYFQMDYRNDDELYHFCSQCFMIVNAAGPSLVIKDKIALFALKCNCHYIDVGGYGTLYNLLQPHADSINAKKKCFLIGAGWMPGISGVFSKAMIESQFSRLEKTSFKVYFGAVDNWSYNSTYDLAVSSMGALNSYKYSYGEKVPVSSAKDTCCRRFPCIGRKKICVPSFDDQLIFLATSQPQIREISTYVMVNDYTSMCKFMYLKAFYKRKLDKAARLLQKDYKRLVANEGKWGSVICQISQEGRPDTYHYLYTNDNLLYTAVTAVITVQYLLEGKVKTGLNYLCDSLDCKSFMTDLEKYGIKPLSDEE